MLQEQRTSFKNADVTFSFELQTGSNNSYVLFSTYYEPSNILTLFINLRNLCKAGFTIPLLEISNAGSVLSQARRDRASIYMRFCKALVLGWFAQ